MAKTKRKGWFAQKTQTKKTGDKMKHPKIVSIVRIAAFIAAAALSIQQTRATPYASCITNNAGTINFHLNENGGNVTVTYENGSTNASYNGITTGTNLPPGLYTFSLTGHSSYSISVSKVGTGLANVITNGFVLGDYRGIDVNKNPTSPYFGQIYAARSAAASPAMAFYTLDSDNTFISSNNAGEIFTPGNTSSPYRIGVAPDDYLMVGDFSSTNSSIYRVSPDLTTSQLVLGPPGVAAGQTAGVHGSEESRPLLIGKLAGGGSATLLEIDGNFPTDGSHYNDILVYSNITLATLPRSSTGPDLYGPVVGLPANDGITLNNTFAGLTEGPNGYIYASYYRQASTPGNPAALQIYDSSITNQVWNSQYNGGSSDYFINAYPGGSVFGLIDSAVSPDGKYVVGVSIDNHFTICSLTNGIPDVSTLFVVKPTSSAQNGRAICWDAADNIYFVSSGTAVMQVWSLGFSATAVTTGNAGGTTGFSVTVPSTSVSVTATNPIASQANSYGNPTNAVFTITRAGSLNSSLVVPFTLSGTASNGTYVAVATTGVTLAPGQASTNITITAVTDGIARPTTTVILTLGASALYSVASPGTATIFIVNTAPDEVVASVDAPTMYNAFSNDYASFVLTRLGDTNAASFTVSSFTLTGTAIAGTDYTLPGPITFNPGDISYTNTISPLSGGQLPVDSTANPFVGNKTVIVGVASGSGYSGAPDTATLAIIDSATPTATVLFSDPLTDPNDATNWGVTSANNNMQNNAIDNTIAFGYNLQTGDPSDYGAIPLPPSGVTNALRVTVNKDVSPGAAAAVNLYPTNVSFSGNYAVRFNMNIIEGYNPSVTTEGALFGINHSGQQTNWWSGSGIVSGWGTPATNVWGSDGIWYWISADGGAGEGDYIEYTGLGGTNDNTGWEEITDTTRASYANAFKTNVFTTTGGPGLVANGSVLNGSAANNWSDVEIMQYKGVVTLTIDKTTILSYTNTTTFTNGTLMLGYNDPFSSVGTLDAAVYFSNLRVVAIGSPVITQIVSSGANVVINFTTVDGDLTAASFGVQSSVIVDGTYGDAGGVTITALGGGAFQAVVPKNGATQFYRIVENE